MVYVVFDDILSQEYGEQGDFDTLAKGQATSFPSVSGCNKSSTTTRQEEIVATADRLVRAESLPAPVADHRVLSAGQVGKVQEGNTSQASGTKSILTSSLRRVRSSSACMVC